MNPIEKLRNKFAVLEQQISDNTEKINALYKRANANKEGVAYEQLLLNVNNMQNELEELKNQLNGFAEDFKLHKDLSWHEKYYYDCAIADIEKERIEQKLPGNQMRLEALKDKHKGQRCFIIGNGPSLCGADLDLIKDEITFGCNKIYKVFDETDWTPTYYSITDMFFFEYCTEEVINACNKMNKSQKLFCSLSLKFLNEVYADAIYFYRNGIYRYIPEFNNHADKFVYEGGTVVYVAMQFAAYMGFSEIYLLGIDNVFATKKLENGSTIYDWKDKSAHFYSDNDDVLNKMYETTAWLDPTKHHECGIYDMQNTYNAAKWHADNIGMKIYNCTRGGALEIFPRATLEEVIASN